MAKRAPAGRPHTDPGTERSECLICGEQALPGEHRCGGFPLTSVALDRWLTRESRR